MPTDPLHQNIPEDLIQSDRKTLYKPPDVELWNKIKQGDEASFILIYNDYFDPLYQFGSQFTRNGQLVEDAIQDVFIKIRENRQSIEIKSSIKLYLFKSLKNKIIYLTERENKSLNTTGLDEENQFEVSFSIEQKLVESQLKKEQRLRLDQAIKKLTTRQREAIYYFYFENMSYKEIQDLMNFNQIQGIRNLIYRSLAHLKSQLIMLVAVLYF